jgi:uncharacterized protein (TIRG00374 family)
MTRRILLIVVGLLISASALAWAAKGIEWQKLGTVLSGLAAWVPLAAITAYLLSFAPRAYRSQWMLAGAGPAPLSLAHAGESQIMGYAANNVLPLRLGEFVRVFALHKLAGLPRVTGLASLLAERILDGLMVVLILGGSVTWFAGHGTHFEQTAVKPLLYTGVCLFALAILGLIVLASMSGWITRLSERLLPPRLHTAVANILTALAFFRAPKRALGVVILSALVWLVEGSVFVLVISSLGVKAPWMAGYFMLAIVNLGILLPSAPGYVGVFQACGILAFEALGLPREQGLAASLLIHICQFLPITVIGLLLASRHGWSLKTMAQANAKSTS